MQSVLHKEELVAVINSNNIASNGRFSFGGIATNLFEQFRLEVEFKQWSKWSGPVQNVKYGGVRIWRRV
jgi:hypothetical protein